MHTRTGSGAMKRLLVDAAAKAGEGEAPYDFAEFQRRAAARRASPPARASARWQALRVAAVVAPLGLVLVIAAVLRTPAAPETGGLALDAAEPALVEAGELATAGVIEDHIAFIDSMLSGAPASAERSALQESRRALTDSLQQVRFARTLLSD